MRICFQCGAEISYRERVPFKELCPKCEFFLHCCRNCRLYSADAHNHCLSSTTAHVPDVERANYCEEFDFREILVEPGSEPRARSAGREEKAEAPPAEGGLSAREKFERLFKD